MAQTISGKIKKMVISDTDEVTATIEIHIPNYTTIPKLRKEILRMVNELSNQKEL